MLWGDVKVDLTGEMHFYSVGFSALVASGSLKRTALLISIWIAQTLGFYGFNAWVPTLLTEHGFSIVRSLRTLIRRPTTS